MPKKKKRQSSPALFDRLFGTGEKKSKSGGSFTDQLIRTGKKAGGSMGRTGRPKKKR